MKIRAYLDRYCDDYKKNTAKLQLHATLIFERDAGLHPPLVARAAVEAKVGSWWRTMPRYGAAVAQATLNHLGQDRRADTLGKYPQTHTLDPSRR